MEEQLYLVKPAEPYWTAMRLIAHREHIIVPYDSEGAMFIGEIPIVASCASNIEPLLDGRRVAIIREKGIMIRAQNKKMAGLLQSVACFSCVVRFLVDAVKQPQKGYASHAEFRNLFAGLTAKHQEVGALKKGTFTKTEIAREAMVEAGKEVVRLGLVNASFGNISYVIGETLLISATGSFLDDLDNSLVAVPLLQSSPQDKSASSELPAHRKILLLQGLRAVLHGHPLFTVVASLIADSERINGVPVVQGETGGGKRGLDKVLPQALQKSPIAIVQGHGVFCVDGTDYRQPIKRMLQLEEDCMREYSDALEGKIVHGMKVNNVVPNGDKKRPQHPMPDFVRRSLIDSGLLAAYQARPPYQRNDYIGWINRAKLQKTKEKRLLQMLEELAKGGVYMNMAHPPSNRGK
ncbi:MAG: class II aldolase/adducin family protein [Deltaproteobacteria bacterium]|nr:class II aldolase/adducin family protein [Deltaproteobacteria bacterium]